DLVEATATAEVELEPLLDLQLELLPEWEWTTRRDLAARYAQDRQQALAALGELLWGYLRAPGAKRPALVGAFVTLARALLELDEHVLLLAEALLAALRPGLELPPALQGPYLELLAEHHARIWDPAAERLV